jgi:DNA-binding NtrC family response regulator
VLVLDETLEVARHVHALFTTQDAEATLVASPHEFRQVEAAQGGADLVVVNLTGGFTAWEIARLLRASCRSGLGLVLHDRGVADLRYFAGVPGVRCVPRPREGAKLAALLQPHLRPVMPAKSPLARDAPATAFAPDIIARSPQILEVLDRIRKAAPGNANVCIVGESGTGKELLARAIHDNSSRRDRPLVTLDCTTVPEGLMESHLFASAVEDQEGLFLLADGGTLFIDEVRDLSPALQTKLLRVIEAREFHKATASRPIPTDIRVITATSEDLRPLVAAGTFRQDLYYRVAVVTVQVPPLRERREDIQPLVDHFLEKFAAAHRKPVPELTADARAMLLSDEWPGNVRQLENCIEQAVVLSEGGLIGTNLLALSGPAAARAAGGIRLRSGLTLREVEQQYIVRTLRDTGGNRTRAARLLGISLRCLQYKLKSYAEDGISIPAQPNRAKETHQLLGV